MEGPEKDDKREWLVYAGLVAVLVFVVFAPAMVLAAGLFFALRGQLMRREMVAGLALALVGLGLFVSEWVGSYGSWLMALVGLGGGSRTDVPWLAVAGQAVLFVCAALLLDGRGAMGWLPSRSTGSAGILPTAKEKQAAMGVIVATPADALLADVGSRSLAEPVVFGQRSFPIGVDKRGTPVMISEAEIRTHGLLFGSTGSGKTETIKVIAGGLLDLGWSGLILDLKEDAQTGGLLDWCGTYADYHDVGFQIGRAHV